MFSIVSAQTDFELCAVADLYTSSAAEEQEMNVDALDEADDDYIDASIKPRRGRAHVPPYLLLEYEEPLSPLHPSFSPALTPSDTEFEPFTDDSWDSNTSLRLSFPAFRLPRRARRADVARKAPEALSSHPRTLFRSKTLPWHSCVPLQCGRRTGTLGTPRQRAAAQSSLCGRGELAVHGRCEPVVLCLLEPDELPTAAAAAAARCDASRQWQSATGYGREALVDAYHVALSVVGQWDGTTASRQRRRR